MLLSCSLCWRDAQTQPLSGLVRSCWNLQCFVQLRHECIANLQRTPQPLTAQIESFIVVTHLLQESFWNRNQPFLHKDQVPKDFIPRLALLGRRKVSQSLFSLDLNN